MSGSKPCPTCDRTRPEAAFARHTASPDGLRAECRECFSARDHAIGRQSPLSWQPRQSRRNTPPPWEPSPGLGAALRRVREGETG